MLVGGCRGGGRSHVFSTQEVIVDGDEEVDSSKLLEFDYRKDGNTWKVTIDKVKFSGTYNRQQPACDCSDVSY